MSLQILIPKLERRPDVRLCDVQIRWDINVMWEISLIKEV